MNTTFSFSQDMTKNALALIDSFFDLRMNLSLIEESETDKINSEIDSFAVKNKDKISVLSEIENLVIENFIIIKTDVHSIYLIFSVKKSLIHSNNLY